MPLARRPRPARHLANALTSTLAGTAALILVLAWAPAQPARAGGLQRCVVDGEVWYTDGPCPDLIPGQPVTPDPRPLGNLDDARRVTREADKLWLYKRGDGAGSGDHRARDRKQDTGPPPRPHSIDLINAIRARQILDGMTPEEVEQAWGPPNTTRRGSDERMSWTYRGKDKEGRRRTRTVKFFQGHVSGWSGTDERARMRFDQNAGRWLE